MKNHKFAVSSNLLVLTLSCAVLVSGLDAEARGRGGVSDGGGSAVGGVPTSHVSGVGAEMIDPSTLAGFKIAETVIANLQRSVPEFAEKYQKVLTEKIWYLESRPLTGCSDPGFLIDLNQKIVACQNSLEVRISKSWFETEAQDDLARAQLIVHEMNRSLYLKSLDLETERRIRPEAVHALDRFLFSDESKNEKSIQMALGKFGFGRYRTVSDVRAANERIKSRIAAGEAQLARYEIEYLQECRRLNGIYENETREQVKFDIGRQLEDNRKRYANQLEHASTNGAFHPQTRNKALQEFTNLAFASCK